ncbi:MAG: PEGA domain-containing protein [Myxococcota bacterium]|jgi:hypothetical protein|nr:PEGA domain-containing protein [Myxococcota bacterium]
MIRRPILAVLLNVLVLGFASTAAAQETVAVMKFELRGGSADIADMMTSAIKNEVRQTAMTLSTKGGDVTLPDAQFVNDCDSLEASCLDPICDFMESSDVIFGSIEGSGEVKLGWYRKGSGMQRSLNGFVASQEDAGKLARRLIAGEQGMLVVRTGDELGAEVLVDGLGVGITPYEAELPVGSHTVQVRKTGFEDTQVRSIEVRQNETVSVDFELVAMAVGAGNPELVTWGWVLSGVGAAAMVGAVVTGVLVLQNETALSDEMKKLPTTENPKAVIDEANSIKSTGETLATTTTILWGVGGTLAVAGLTLVLVGYLSGGSEEAEATAFQFNMGVSGDGAMATMGWRF